MLAQESPLCPFFVYARPASRKADRGIFQMNGFEPVFFAQVYFDPVRNTGGAFFTTGHETGRRGTIRN